MINTPKLCTNGFFLFWGDQCVVVVCTTPTRWPWNCSAVWGGDGSQNGRVPKTKPPKNHTLSARFGVHRKNRLGLKSKKKTCNKTTKSLFGNCSLSLGIQSYSQMIIRVSNHLLRIVFRFRYHSQKVIGSLGYVCVHDVATNMDVSKIRGTPKSSILIGFSIINHPFWGTIIFGNTHMFGFCSQIHAQDFGGCHKIISDVWGWEKGVCFWQLRLPLFGRQTNPPTTHLHIFAVFFEIFLNFETNQIQQLYISINIYIYIWQMFLTILLKAPPSNCPRESVHQFLPRGG